MAQRMPGVRLWNLYGQTEIAPLATMLGPEDQLRKPGSCGRPALNVETRVVDDHMRDVKPGEVGEIVHRSPHLMLGYFHDDERTKTAFEGGWFHSGDLATIDEDGYITVVDRKKDMIKTGGENVASREVEEAIYRLPEVSEVAVIGVPHPRWIEAVVAVIVVKAGMSLSKEALLLRPAPGGVQGTERSSVRICRRTRAENCSNVSCAATNRAFSNKAPHRPHACDMPDKKISCFVLLSDDKKAISETVER